MKTTQVVLVDQTGAIDPTLLHAAAIALNQQVTQDLPQHWSGITAAVSVAPTLTALPHGAWPVFLVKDLPPGEGGFHLDKRNQPYAKVIASPDDESWTVDASHEIIEMLVDPFGNRLQSSEAIKIDGNGVIDTTGTFSYLVEACDPCEANEFAYDIGGIALSDFITPHFYDAAPSRGTLYSCRGNIGRPRELLKGGYISYERPDGEWQQILWVNPGAPQLNNLGDMGAVRSLRKHVHDQMAKDKDKNGLEKAKHGQRRKPGGLPSGVRERTEEFKSLRKHGHQREEMLFKRYALK